MNFDEKDFSSIDKVVTAEEFNKYDYLESEIVQDLKISNDVGVNFNYNNNERFMGER